MSDHPYYLELILDKRQLILNSKNANQSNENLKKVFHLFFHHFEVYKMKTEKVLLLGLGLGSVIELLQVKNKLTNVVSYENNPQIIQWMHRYYETTRLDIKNQSAEFITEPPANFDLIIVDLFIDQEIPEFLCQLSYWTHLKSLLSPNGILIWNTLIEKESYLKFNPLDIFKQNIDIMGLNRFWVIH